MGVQRLRRADGDVLTRSREDAKVAFQMGSHPISAKVSGRHLGRSFRSEHSRFRTCRKGTSLSLERP